jgi:replicative DNA helicase
MTMKETTKPEPGGANTYSATVPSNGFSLAQKDDRTVRPLRERQVLHVLIGGEQDDKNLVLEKVRTHHFSSPATLKLFNWTLNIFLNGKTITEQAVISAIQIQAKPAEYEDMMNLLAEVMLTPVNDTVENAYDDLQNAYLLRLIHQEILLRGTTMFHSNATPEQLINHITTMMTSLETGEEAVDFKQHLHSVVDKILNPKAESGGLMTGLKDYDAQFGGVKQDRMYVIGGYNGSGKTAKMIDLICRLCLYHMYWLLPDGQKNDDGTRWDYARGYKIAIKFFSLEMSEERIIFRIISWLTQITGYQLENQGIKNAQGEWLVAQLTDKQRDDVLDAYAKAKEWPLEITYTTASAKTLKLIGKKFALKNKGKHLIYILDHLGMVDKEGKDNRIAFDENMEMMKSFQRDHKASTFPLIQLSKDTEKGKDAEKRFFRPNNSHLMESVGVEAMADAIILTWRPGKKWNEIPYDGNTKWNCQNKLIDIVGKNRDGKAYCDIIYDCRIEYNTLMNYLDF